MEFPQITPTTISTRLLAWILDLALTVLILLALVYLFSGTFDAQAFLLVTNYVELVLLFAIPTAFHLWFANHFVKTPGMMVMDLQFVTRESGIPNWTNYIRRPFGLPLVLISPLFSLMNRKHRTLVDILSGLRVVDSVSLGHKITFDTYRVFMSILRPLVPASAALALIFLLVTKTEGRNSDLVWDALVLVPIATVALSLMLAGIISRITRVRLSSRGIQRSGWFGWSDSIVPWTEVDHAVVMNSRLFPRLRAETGERRRFSVPLERGFVSQVAGVFHEQRIRIEQ